MQPATLFLLFAAVVLSAVIFWLFFYRSWRRQRELDTPFPPRWRQLLREQLPHYAHLNSSQQLRLEQCVQLFMAEKTFYGCDGFTINDRVRITIAGHACLLLLGRSFSHFDDIRSILVYPDVYKVPNRRQDGLVVHQGNDVRAGEAWSAGRVVLAWTSCEEASKDRHFPHNVVLHEFAHQLDYLDGMADGAPPLTPELSEDWPRIMTAAFNDLQQAMYYQQRPWLDPYGATEPAEFFAVLTETFYQQPQHLQQHQPQLYDLLCRYYRVDPRQFSAR